MTSHADILNSDRGHIFRKYRRKNNKKITLIYEKTVKTVRYQGIAMHRIACVSRVLGAQVTMAFCVRAIYLTQKTLRAHTAGGRQVFDPE